MLLRLPLKSASHYMQSARDSQKLSSNLETWKIPALLVALIFSFGNEGNIIPNTEDWWENFYNQYWRENDADSCDNNNDNNNTNSYSKSYNITDVILQALCSVLEVIFYTNAENMTEVDLNTYDGLICNARLKLNSLYEVFMKYIINLSCL